MASPGPSLPGAFDIVGAAGPDRLIRLKHKLRVLRAGCQGADLLLAMVLLQLGQDTEARVSLDALKGDAAARLVARQWAGVDTAPAPEEPQDVSWAVARLYHLLAQEGLCPASMRDEAYRAALRSLGPEDPGLAELRAEAQDRCGWGVAGDPGGFRTLCSHLGPLPPSSASPLGARSLPRPIDPLSGWSRGCSLRSTGSPASLASDLEISQSPTVLLGSPRRSPHGPSKLCGESGAGTGPDPVSAGRQVPEEMSWPPSVETASALGRPESPAAGPPGVASDLASAGLPDFPAAPEASKPHSVDSEPRPPPAAEHSQSSCPLHEQTPPRESVESTTTQNTKPGPPSLPETSLPPPPPPPQAGSSAASTPTTPSAIPSTTALTSGQKFYNFVVLHARADEHVALRVRQRLEALGVPDGATFCEDFQVPGRGELRCLQDAIDHSGFTILLLTPNFDCRLSLHQVGQALLRSLTQHGRQDSVIPYVPLESSPAQLGGSDLAGLLAGLVWLDEHSPIFARKVANTFKPQKLRALRAHWAHEQDARALREHSQHLEGERRQAAAVSAACAAYLQSHWAWRAQMEALQAAFGSRMSFGTQVPYPSPGPLEGLPTMPTRPGGPPPPMAGPPASPMPPQPLIIHHAQMVQLGLNNHMWNQKGAQTPEDKTQGAE